MASGLVPKTVITLILFIYITSRIFFVKTKNINFIEFNCLNIRLGCFKTRYNHSKFNFIIQWGALFSDLLITSKLPPTGIKSLIFFNLSLYFKINSSCFGQPRPTNRMFAPEL